MTTEETIDLDAQTDLIPTNCECPQCGSKYLRGVPYVSIPCKKCGITYKTDFKMDSYTKKARQIIQKLSYSNSLTIKVTGDGHERDATQIHHHFTEQNCWDLTEIKRVQEITRWCDRCGICLDCYTCSGCGETFKKNPNRKTQRCPKCKSDEFTKTHFTNASTIKDLKACPSCKSTNIRMTITKNATVCERCGSEKFLKKRNDSVYQFTISRKKAYRIENFERD